MSILNKLFGQRSRGFGGFRRRSPSFTQTLGRHRGGLALGTLASIAAPFLMRKLRSRRAQRTAAY